MKAPIMVLALLAVVALSGCVSSGDGQNDKYEGSLEALRDTRHIVADCAYTIDGAKGIEFKVTECSFELANGKVENADWTCTGLTGNTQGTAYGNLESNVHVAVYSAGGSQHSDSFGYDIERGDSASGKCAVEIPTDDYGGYTVKFDPTCYEDANPYWFGFQAKEMPCSSFVDEYSVTKGWF